MGKKREGSPKTSSHVCHHPFKKRRQDAAIVQTERRNERSAKEQLEELDRRLGVGVGALKERARLQKMIDAKN